MRVACLWRGDVMDLREEALVSLRAAYPEWTFELDGQAISARLAPSRHLVLWTGIAAWKAKAISWPNGPALLDQLGGYVASSPDEVRCMAALLGAIAAAEGGATPDAPGEPVELFGSCADPDEPEWTDEDLEINTVTNARERLAAALRERDEALAKVAALRCEADKASEARDMALYLNNRRQGEYDQMRATLARYTAVYADPDMPAPPPAADLSRCAPLPGMAEMAQRILGVPADAPDDGLAHDDWEVPPSPDAVAQVREALRRADHALAGLRNALIVERELQARCAELERERDEARAELERVKAALDGFYSRMIAPQAQVTVGIEHQIEKNASAKRFNAEVLTTLAAAASSLESLACNARLALFAGYDPIEVFSEVAGLATHLARRVADGTLPGEVPQASDVVVFACELDDVALASMTRWQAELAAWQARELPCDDEGEQRWRLYAGVQEELGEVARCLLKGSQGIRGGAEVWRAQLPGEIGDVLVYLTQLATACGVDLGAAYAEARAKVLARRFATAEVPK